MNTENTISHSTDQNGEAYSSPHRNNRLPLFLAVVCATLLSFTATHAQHKFQPSTMIGVHGGMNVSYMSFDPTITQVGFQGNMAGIFVRYVSEPHLGFQVELNRSVKGYKEDLLGENAIVFNPSKNNFVYTHELEFYSIPIMTYVELGKRNTRFSFYIGPQVSYMNSQQTNMQPADSLYVKPYHSLESNKNIMYGLLGGAGIMQKTSIGVFQLNLRYERTLTNLLDEEASGFLLSANNTISVYVGYSIYLKGKKKKK